MASSKSSPDPAALGVECAQGVLSAGLPVANAPVTPWWICCPALSGLPPELGDALLTAPRADANGAVLELLAASPGPWKSEVFIALFATDPFRRSQDLIRALLRSGVAGVVNWPTVGHLDGRFGESLAAVGHDVGAELALLREARAAGLKVMATVASIEAGRTALTHGIDALLVHPGWARRDPALNARQAERAEAMLQAFSAPRTGTVPALLLYRPHGYGAALRAAESLADAVIERSADAHQA